MSEERPLVRSVVVRVYLDGADDLDTAVPLYQRLAGEPPRRFGFQGTQLALIGPFLLSAGGREEAEPDEGPATVAVTDMNTTVRILHEHGALFLEGPTCSEAGKRLVVRHPDGALFEYVEPA